MWPLWSGREKKKDKGGWSRGDTHEEDEVEEEQEVLDRRHAAFSHDVAPAHTERHKQVKGSSGGLDTDEGGDKS